MSAGALFLFTALALREPRLPARVQGVRSIVCLSDAPEPSPVRSVRSLPAYASAAPEEPWQPHAGASLLVGFRIACPCPTQLTSIMRYVKLTCLVLAICLGVQGCAVLFERDGGTPGQRVYR